MIILEKVLRNNWTFYIFLGCIYLSCFFVIAEVADAIRDYQRSKTLFDKRLKQKGKAIQELQQEVTEVEIDVNLQWKLMHMRMWCKQAQLINPGWKCPDVYKDIVREHIKELQKK